MKIITVTLSPAIDIHCNAENFHQEKENFAKITSRDAGGKGVNISRALNSYGIGNMARVAVGEENGDDFLSILNSDEMEYIAVHTKGRIRENITVHPVDAKETRLSFDGFCGNIGLLNEIENYINKNSRNNDIVAIAGRIPSGIKTDEIKSFVQRLKAKGLLLVIDSRSFSPADIIECTPFLIKPNEEEIAAYIGKEAEDLTEVAKAAKSIHQKGVDNVIISLGARGAVLACACGLFYAEAPKIKALSTIGAGDSFIAGFLIAYTEGSAIDECLRTAVAFGSAACLTEGTKPPRKEDINMLIRKTRINRI